ncbi:hypothetical protein WJX74_001831 [Apatococcus lobatus]|uniref:RING-type E3 ubiquitin transferase (cysteine targeting) n=1 Tax=Apatococcus lobatus TaxID=904363 RepID=A0AAW1Q6E8_9CHLO
MTPPQNPSDSGVPTISVSHEWQSDLLQALPELKQLRRQHIAPWCLDILRASQLDAARLDTEILLLLQEQFMEVFAKFDQRVVRVLQPELTLFLDSMVFGLSVLQDKPSPGMSLLNLRFRNETPHCLTAATASQGTALSRPSKFGAENLAAFNSGNDETSMPKLRSSGQLVQRTGAEGPGLSIWQRSLIGLWAVAGQYLAGRVEACAAAEHWLDEPSSSWPQRAWVSLRLAEAAHSLASLANFLAFLRYGHYRSLVERLLGARLVYQRTNMARALSFEYLNRQLIWHEMSELLLFLLPLLNLSWLRRLRIPYLPGLIAPSTPQLSAGSHGPNGQPKQSRACGICGLHEMLVPYEAIPCCHVFCYYCIRSQSKHDQQLTCPRCEQVVSAIRRCSPRKMLVDED